MESKDSKNIYTKSLIYAFSMMLFFLVTAIGSTYLGKYIDSIYNTAPYGYTISTILGYILSIIITLTILLKSNLINRKKSDV